MSVTVRISKRLALLNSASMVATRIVNITVLVWLQQYLLRRISPGEYAIYPVLASIIVFLGPFMAILTGGLSRFTVEAYAKGDEPEVTRIFSTMLPLLAGAAAAVMVSGLTLSHYIDRVLNLPPTRLSDARVMTMLMTGSLAISLLTAGFEAAFYVRQKFILRNAVDLGTEVLRIAVLFGLLFGLGARVLWVAVAVTAAVAGRCLATVVIARRLVPALRFRLASVHWRASRKLVSFGLWQFVYNFANTVREALDPIVLNKLSTPVAVSSFYLARMADRGIRDTVYVAFTPLLPALTAMHAAGDLGSQRSAFLRGGRYALWASLLVAVPLMVLGREIVTLYVGQTFLPAATAALLLLLVLPVSYGNFMLGRLAVAKGRMRGLALRAVAMHSGNVALTLYLVGPCNMGAVGSALGTFLAFLVCDPVLFWPLGMRFADVRMGTWLRQTLLPGLQPGLAAAAVLLGLRFLLRPSTWAAIGVCVALGAACYLLVLFLFGLRSPDRADLRYVLRKLFPKRAGAS